jgi:hypothetical protein
MSIYPLFQDAAVDSTSYLVVGYVIIGTVGLGYVLSLWLRQRSLKRDLEVIERLQNDE